MRLCGRGMEQAHFGQTGMTGQWVKCSDRMPTRGELGKWGDALCVNANGEMYIVAWYDIIRATVDMGVTHWTAMPDAPKEDLEESQ